jgi:hypothetical protein
MSIPIIEDADIELVLECYEAEQDAPTLNDYFSAIAYPKTSRLERNAALIMMRRAWVKALSRSDMPKRLKPSHARGYVLRQEFYVRESMNGIDDLPVTPMPWNSHWPA